MSYAESATEAVNRLSLRDCTLEAINLNEKDHNDEELAELADCLLAHPDVVTHVYLDRNRLTDETGVKLARYLAVSSTIQVLDLSHNQLGEATYMAVAAALRANTSLRGLHLRGNKAVDWIRVDTAFIEALRLNPHHPTQSLWYLYSSWSEFQRLKRAAEQLGHPSLQLLLALMC